MVLISYVNIHMNWSLCLQWFYAYTSTIQKVNYKLYTHKFINCILLLCVYMCVCSHGVFVCICVWMSTCMDMHACTCHAQRLVFVAFYYRLAWFLRQDLSLNFNSPIARLAGQWDHGMPRLPPNTGLQTAAADVLHGCWRWKLGSLCLHSKHFIHSISQATKLFLKGSQAKSSLVRKQPHTSSMCRTFWRVGTRQQSQKNSGKIGKQMVPQRVRSEAERSLRQLLLGVT